MNVHRLIAFYCLAGIACLIARTMLELQEARSYQFHITSGDDAAEAMGRAEVGPHGEP